MNPESKPKYGVIRTCLRGVPFQFATASSVFSRKRLDTGTRLLIEQMTLPKKGFVLDVGCGYGAVGIAAAFFNPELQVILTDVNKRALRLAQENAERNKIANFEMRQGHLYEPVEKLRFDCILSNPPVSAGMKIVKDLIIQAPLILVQKGNLQMVVRSKVGMKLLPSIFQSVFCNCRVLARQGGYRILMAEKQCNSPPASAHAQELL